MRVTIADAKGEMSADLRIRRLYNLGSATRDPESARAHQDEVAHIGVKIAFDVPAPRIYPLSPDVLTTAGAIEVQGDRTSGEVEIVLIKTDDFYVGVGSDHTDRTLEKVSILWSKQACANVLAPKLWRFSEIAAHWDSCRLRSWVDGKLYQDVGVGEFLRPEDLLRLIGERTGSLPARDFAIFCGTYASIDKTVSFGRVWRIELSDPVAQRAISHEYRVDNILAEIRPEFRVPLAAKPL
jgi:4-hydroxyphenylacetate 3-monooxygenase